MLVVSEKKILRWLRFTLHLYDSNMAMQKTQWDAITFVPKIDITLLGFTFFDQNTHSEFTLRFKILVGDNEHCDKEIRAKLSSMADKNDPKVLYIDLEKEGFTCPEVRSKEKLHILIKAWEDNYSDGYYGYGTVDSNADPVNAGNENDFDIETSKYSETRTSH